MELLAMIFFALAVIVLIMGIIFVIVFYRPIGGYDVEFDDNIPARYEDYERPFYNP